MTVFRFPVMRCKNPESKLGVQASDARGATSPQSILNTLRPADFTGSNPSVGLYVLPCSAAASFAAMNSGRSEEHTSELQSHSDLVCRLLLEKKKTKSQM